MSLSVSDQAEARVQPAACLSGHAFDLVDVVHRYGSVTALDHVSLSASGGEFLTLLGHSGSGKTSLLKIIAGLEMPTSVRKLTIGGVDVRAVPAHRRNTTTVFQSYALFPHMSVLENVEYGLGVRGVAAAERRRRALDMLDAVRLSGLHARGVMQLSGGERQRVALARALVTRPAVLLLDEPLGALDERLRIDMQVELLQLQRHFGMTFLYVTHSQEEALTMSDRVVLLNKGRIVQEGPPAALFDRPANRFVAEFMGVENLIDGAFAGMDGDAAVFTAADVTLRGKPAGMRPSGVGSPVVAAIRAERLRLAKDPPRDGINALPCTLEQSIYKGKYLDQTVSTPIGPLKVRIWDTERLEADVRFVCWDTGNCTIVG